MNSSIDSIDVQRTLTVESKIKIGVIFSLAVLLFAPVIRNLINIWHTNEDYSHGFLVIPIALYIVWAKRKKLVSLQSDPLWSGLPVLAISAMFYIVSYITRFHIILHISMLFILVGLLLFMGGWGLTKELSLALVFLLFMFPIPSEYYILMTNPLKLFITKISTEIIYLMGVPVYREGNILFLATTQLEVAEACSGVRSLYSYLMLACLFAFMCRKKASRIILPLSALPLAIFINILRVSGTGIIADYFGPEVAQGFFHKFSGLVLFVLGFVLLFLEYLLIDYRVLIEES
jgi:exosortase